MSTYDNGRKQLPIVELSAERISRVCRNRRQQNAYKVDEQILPNAYLELM